MYFSLDVSMFFFYYRGLFKFFSLMSHHCLYKIVYSSDLFPESRMASKFKASHNIGTLFLAIIASFLLSTVVLLLPRFYCATESATEFPSAPVVLTRNLHGAPEPKVLPAISDEVKNVNESKPASSKSSPKAGADIEEFNSKTSNVTKGLHTPPLSLGEYHSLQEK